MYEKLDECPSCKHTKFYNHLICKDYTVSGESFALMKCAKCDLIFTNPRPDQEHIGKYYEDANYISHTNKANNLVNLAYKTVRKFTLNQKLDLIQQYTKAVDLLDFGAGTGIFLQHMRAKKYHTEGLETHPQTAKLASEISQSTIHTDIHDIKPNSYDIITAWHVIEHVHDLKNTLKVLRKALKEKGYLFIALPNHLSYDAEIYKEYWAAYDVPKHLYHFDKNTFTTLAKKAKLNIVDIHPMIFDSYYVSMLSEKNQNGKPNYSTAIKNGFRSNKKAKQTGEYSSLIYVLTA